MRKIEQQMIKAIREGRNWKSGNTKVVVLTDELTGMPYADVYLHDNHIAVATPNTWDVHPHANPNKNTFYVWPTVTTRSRLRALGVNASIKKGNAVLDGMVVSNGV
jgi:hypothetical protein